MEFTNLMFAVLLLMIFTTGIFTFFLGVQENYPSAASANPRFMELAETVNQSYIIMNANVTSAITNARQFQNSDNSFAAAFGYIFGALQAVGQLVVGMPIFFLQVTEKVADIGSPFIPSWLPNIVITGISVVVIIGLLYYLLKVK